MSFNDSINEPTLIMDTHLLLSSLNVTIDGNIPLLVLCAIVLIVVLFSDLVDLAVALLLVVLVGLVTSVVSFITSLSGLFKRR